MNKQDTLDLTNFRTFGTSTQLFYLEIESDPIDETDPQAVPLSLVNNTNNHFLVPTVRSSAQNEVCVYVESEPNLVEGNSSVNYIKGQKYCSVTKSTYCEGNYTADPTVTTPASTKDITSSAVTSSKFCKNTIEDSSFQIVSSGSKDTKQDVKRKRNIKGFVHFSDRLVPPRALAVLPAALRARGGAVAARRALPERVRFGPVQGVNHTLSPSAARDMVLDAAMCKRPLFLLKGNDSVIHIDVTDKDKSNWFALLPLGTQCTANVWLYEEDNNLFGITVQSIPCGAPLALGYTRLYMQDHGFPTGQPMLDVSEDLSVEPRRWWCSECESAFSALSLLRAHLEQCHSEDVKVVRRRHLCRHCTRSYTRLSTLKRHMARYCNKKTKQQDKSTKTKPAEDVLNTSFNIEDNRLPSDESFQNYTNGLDFSTSLFDTDRMPGLDISGSSRSETEFNMINGIPFRDENAMTPDLGLYKISNDHGKSQNNLQEKKNQAKSPNETLLISCHRCKQTILREKKRQHLSKCPAKRFECECGRVFTSSEKFARHVNENHRQLSPDTAQNTENGKSNDLEYKCEKCELTFKRRGMLVNHLWRAHGSRAAVPLQRRERLFPCAACPKLYRTAAKRDRHHNHNHPGVSVVGRYAIEGARRAVAPAACGACPRQYATRAKLLQHVRRAHPGLAPPPKRSSTSVSDGSQNIITKTAEQIGTPQNMG